MRRSVFRDGEAVGAAQTAAADEPPPSVNVVIDEPRRDAPARSAPASRAKTKRR